jgi:hypothetical protein
VVPHNPNGPRQMCPKCGEKPNYSPARQELQGQGRSADLMAQMSDADLRRSSRQEETQALGYHAGDLSREREKSLDYYHGNVRRDGRRRALDVVSTDVRDAVDGMLPDLLDVFLSSDDVVKFEPQGKEDEKGSQQATDACNYVFYRQNKGALILYEWFKSALLEKNGVVKYYHEKYTDADDRAL